MKVLSLFSGVGGFDMGLENAGMETVFQCEWDKHANSILYKHWPDVPKWDDVSTLTGKHILAHAPVVDVVAWGSPCQDLSVAGKRAGLEGGRSGLFHEGIRIIKELQEETNGQYPRISIWENVVGALNSNGGADFGIILNEMAEAGAVVIEWTVLDAQYWIPQRRKRVFVIAIFDPVLSERCPSPLLPVSESLPGDTKKGKQARKSAATTLTESTGTDGGILGSDIVGSLNTSDAKMISTQYVNENKCVVEPYVKSSRAQTSEDSETWITGEVNPTLNSFDVGDTRAKKAIIEELVLFENSFRDGARISHDGVTQTLTSKMGTGGGNTPMIAIPIQDGRDIEKHQNGLGVAEAGSPAYTLDQTGAQAVAYSIREDAKAGNFSATELDHANSLSALQPSPQSHHAQMFIVEPTLAFDTQFGSNANVTENVSPTLKSSQQSPSVAYPIDTRNALRDPEKYDAQNRQGLGIGADGDPMSTLTSAHVNGVAVQYDGYNQIVNDSDVSTTIRIGRDSSDFIAQPTEPTVFQPGTMVRLGGGVWEGTVPTLRAEAKRGDNEPHIQIHNGQPTMAVRRLTPLECERLMGWPDNHTRYKADGTEQADTHRYKQCGNGVASPVAQWIAKHILAI